MERAIAISVKDAREIIKLLGNERILQEYSPAELFRLYQLRTNLSALVALDEKRLMVLEARRSLA